MRSAHHPVQNASHDATAMKQPGTRPGRGVHQAAVGGGASPAPLQDATSTCVAASDASATWRFFRSSTDGCWGTLSIPRRSMGGRACAATSPGVIGSQTSRYGPIDSIYQAYVIDLAADRSAALIKQISWWKIKTWRVSTKSFSSRRLMDLWVKDRVHQVSEEAEAKGP